MLKNETKPESAQDAFNRVWQHFVVEGNPRCVGAGLCVYRSGNNGCAVGIMLPDELATQADHHEEGGTILTVAQDIPAIREWFDRVPLEVLRGLQLAHDNSTSATLKDRLIEVAKLFNLTVPA